MSRTDRLHVKGACGRLRAVPCRAGLNIGGVHGLRELRIHCVCFAQPWPRRATCSPTVIRGNRLGLHGLFGQKTDVKGDKRASQITACETRASVYRYDSGSEVMLAHYLH